MSAPHPLRDELLHANRGELRRRIVDGSAIDPAALEGWTYRGTALGGPRIVELFSWKTFEKTFWRHPESGRLLGWNVRLHQGGVDAPSRPKTNRAGEHVTTWFYEVRSAADAALPRGWPRGFNKGLVIDYARGNNPALEPLRFAKDPLVSLEPGNPELLLGVSTVTLPGLCVEIPTYFMLEREARVSFVPEAAWRAPNARRALSNRERAWAELMFDALLGAGDDDAASLPSLSAMAPAERARFWRLLDERTPPYFGPGLRACVQALAWAPLLMKGLRRHFASLSPAERIACVERLEESPRYLVRQTLATLKILACFARFESAEVRARLGGDAVLAPPTAPDREVERCA